MSAPFAQPVAPFPGEPRPPGLSDEPKKDWPRVQVTNKTPIESLAPGTALHKHVLEYLLKRLRDSEHAMSAFYPRWRANEKRVQAWIDLPDWERKLKEANDSGKPPRAVNIVIPYMFSTLATQATYLQAVFTGRKPIHQIGTYGTAVENARKLEIVLQYQHDHQRSVRHFWQHFNDFGVYGVAVFWTRWARRFALRTHRVQRPVFDIMTGQLTQQEFREQRETLTYDGNEITPVDPFMFFPDPQVPMAEVSEKGEFVFVRSYEGRHILKREEADGRLKWVDHAPSTPSGRRFTSDESARAILSGGISHPGAGDDNTIFRAGRTQVDQGSVEIIPRELGLGHSEKVEKWLFAILNDGQIVQAEPIINDHGSHPVVVCEPVSMGYSFGSAAFADYLAPIQDTMSWFLNSHQDNVRRHLNNEIVYNPQFIEERDLKNPEPGKLIRLKQAAFGRDIREVIFQLQATDVTKNHINDLETYFEIGQRLSAVTDNLLGLQDPSGRRSATEARQSFESAASRLAALAKVVSAQSISELARQMSLNTQQFQEQSFYLRIVGRDGMLHPIVIDPEGLVGDFYYPVHDGTLPLDRVALFDLWQQLFQGVLTDPELRQSYSVPKIFEFVAELGGAKNIQNFRLQISPDGQVAQQVQQGNLAPIPGAVGPSGLVNATLPNNAQRAAGGLF